MKKKFKKLIKKETKKIKKNKIIKKLKMISKKIKKELS